ncbi:MAG TPA: carboxypeptidase-like regulatory domain-containing protein [Thermoanaerobaculia bacterium]
MLQRALRFLPLLLWISVAAHAAEITLGGEVLDQRERPIEGASFEIERPSSPYEEARTQLEEKKRDPVATALSDARGRFRVAVPKPGMWRVVIRASGFAPQKFDFVPILRSDELLRIMLGPASTARIKVVDDNGRPIAGARLQSASRPENSYQPTRDFRFPASAIPFAKTGSDGTVSIPVGELENITVLADGYLEGTYKGAYKRLNKGVTTVTLVRGCRRVLNVVNLRNQPAAGVIAQSGRWTLGITDASGRVEITAPCGAEAAVSLLTRDGRRAREVLRPIRKEESSEVRFKLPPRAARLKGRVLAADSKKPLAGVLVWTADAPAAFTWSDEQGRFTLRAPAIQDSPLMATADGIVFAHDNLIALGSGGPTFFLQPALAASGTVTDEAARPIEGAEVKIFGDVIARTDKKGRFGLLLSPGGLAQFVITHRDFLPMTLSLASLQKNEQLKAGIVLKRGHVVSGRLIDEAGRPIADANGILTVPEEGLHYVPRAEAFSDAQGHLRFSSLPPGRYDLYVFARGFAPLLVIPVEVGGAGGVTELGALRLSHGAVIEGRVVDQQGRPVAGAIVQAYDQETRDDTVIETGADGRFVMAEFRRGSRINLWAGKQGYGDGRFEGVEAPTQELVTIRLTPMHRHRVLYTVRNEKGEPIPGATLSFFTQEMKRMMRMMSDIAFIGNDAQVDEEGRYEHESAEPGIVTIQARATGYLPREVDIEIPEEGDLENLEITLQTAPAVIVGQVTGPGGEPVGDAYVSVYEKERTGRGLSPGPVELPRTDSNGRFRIQGLTEGQWGVSVDAHGYRRELRDLEVHTGENRFDIRLERGAEAEDQEVDSADRPERENDHKGTISGSILGLDAKALAKIKAVHAYQPPGTSKSSQVTVRGEYRIEGLAPGEWTVSADTGHRRIEVKTNLTAAGSEAHLDLEFPPGVSVSGKILRRGEPVAETTVRVLEGPRTSSWASAACNQRGEFRLEGIDAGSYRLGIFSRDRALLHEQQIELPSDRYIEITLPTNQLSGRVVNAADSSPVPWADVTLNGGRYEAARTRTNADGVFTVQNVAVGHYTVVVEKEGFEPAKATVQLEDGGVADVHLVLQSSAAAKLP